jgi:N-dimethylarginine dimethylaminohydrolase
MLDYSNTACVVHKHAFSPASLRAIQQFLGHSNVTIIDTPDTFCLNAVVDGKNLITHKLNACDRKILAETTGCTIKEVDTSEFEKSGGSVRCMTLDIHLA